LYLSAVLILNKAISNHITIRPIKSGATVPLIEILIINLTGSKKPFDGLTDRKNAEAWKNFVQSGGLAKEISKLFKFYFVSYKH
jgi:hypothetical protein